MQFHSTADFLNFVRNHKIPLSPNQRFIGIRDTLIGWLLIAASIVFFKVPPTALSTEMNFVVQFGVGTLLIFLGSIIYGLIKGQGLQGYKFLKIEGDVPQIGRSLLSVKQRIILIYSRSLIAAVGYIIFEIAKESIGIVDNSAVHVTLLAFFMLRQHFNVSEWIGILIALIGISSVLYFDAGANNQYLAIWGYLFGIGSAISLAIVIMLSSVIIQHDHPIRVTFHQCLCGLILSLIAFGFLAKEGTINDLTLIHFSNAVVCGICYCLALMFFLRAFFYIEPFVVAMLGYSLVIFVAIFQCIINKGLIPSHDLTSSLIIALGCTILIFQKLKKDEKTTPLDKSLEASRPIYHKKKTNRLKQLQTHFDLGELNKYEYISEMYDHVKTVFELSELLKASSIDRISIEKGSVHFTFKNQQLGLEVDNSCRSAPLEILNFGNYEEDEISMVFNLIEEKDVIFDVGSHLGWYSLQLAKKFPNAQIFSFEPMKPTYELLKKNIFKNDVENVRLYNFGLSDLKGPAQFYYPPLGSPLASLENIMNIDGCEKIECNLKRMDDFVQSENIEKINFIKCDVEGSEYFILKGGIQSLTKFTPILVLEIVECWCEKFGYSGNEVIEFLKGHGYQCFFTAQGKLIEVNSIDKEKLEKSNYFFLHREKHAKLIIQFS